VHVALVEPEIPGLSPEPALPPILHYTLLESSDSKLTSATYAALAWITGLTFNYTNTSPGATSRKQSKLANTGFYQSTVQQITGT
jgi:hypothetical protein